MLRILSLLLLCLPLTAQITLDWDDDEIVEITWNGDDYAQNVNGGTAFCCWINYGDATAYTPFDTTPSSKTENIDGWSHTYRVGTDYELGVDVVLSQPCSDCIDIEITIANDGTQPIDYIAFVPLEITNPAGNTSNCQGIDRTAGGSYGPALEIKGTWGKWVLWHEDLTTFWSIRVPCGGDATTNFDAQFLSSSTLTQDDAATSIPAGGTKVATLHMKFAAEAPDTVDVAPAAYVAWRSAWPIAYDFADSRPWLSWFMSSEASVDADGVGADNPRGYIHFTDWTDEATVYTNMLAKADEIVNRANGMSPKPQGVVVWDMEGSEFAHSFTYVGDPTSVCPAGTPDDTSGISPEMCYDNGTGELLIDAIMRKFREGDLRIGVTLRPQGIQYGTTLPETCVTTGSFAPTFGVADYTDTFVKIDRALTPQTNRGCRCNDTGDGWVCPYGIFWQRHYDTRAEVVTELKRKIAYAYERWGVTAYYVDTNSSTGTYWHGIFYEVATEFPNVLIMPEWETAAYTSCCKPYDELDFNVYGPTQEELDYQPSAGVFVNIQDGDRDANATALRMGMRRGSPMMARGWFTSSSEQTFIQTQYALAIEENGVVTLSTGEIYSTTIPIVERVKGSCYPNHLAVRFAGSTEALNACNPLLEQGCGSTTVCRSTESPCTVEDRTAYRHEIHNALREACSVGPTQ